MKLIRRTLVSFLTGLILSLPVMASDHWQIYLRRSNGELKLINTTQTTTVGEFLKHLQEKFPKQIATRYTYAGKDLNVFCKNESTLQDIGLQNLSTLTEHITL
jgi:hypothetical protein